MAGSFEIFRKYQRSLLVAVAILAMLAFFVLPPFLQMGGGTGAADPVAARWSGGEIREVQLERGVAMRSVVNRFLVEAAVAAGRDPSQLPLFPESEEAVVRTMLVAEEAKKNGLVVSDTSINDFLAQWTNNLVRQEQFNDIIAGLRLGPSGVSQHDLFEALRTELVGRNMLVMFQTGFSGDPPAWRWDYYRRLEQKAAVEVVPVPVETVASQVPKPSEQQLRAFFEQYKNDLPDPRSDAPGFREPRRVKYEYVVAKREAFEAEAAKEVTDKEIAEFYEKNKETMFRAKPDVAKTETKTETKTDDKKPDAKPADAKPEATPNKGAAVPSSPFKQAAFKQPAAETKPAVTKPADAKPTETAKAADAKPAGAEPPKTDVPKADAPKTDAPKADVTTADASKAETPKAEVKCEPLEDVKEKIREQLARERANARIDAVFSAIAGDVTRYAEDYALWQARQVASAEPPKAPDIDVIAKKQGLEAGRSGLVTAARAVSGGGIGQSFEFIPDPGSRFGIRQQNWLEAVFGQNTIGLRPVTSRDMAGNRYLSWKTDDQPEATPAFDAVRDNVEFSWRIVEGRGLARKQAEEIAAQAKAASQSLEAAAAARGELKVAQVGPFTWLSEGANPGSPPAISQPDGVEMPGDEFMKTVFALEPGQTAVAFNEPRTVCYCIRLVSFDPPATELRDRFLQAKSDPRRIGMVAQQEFSESFGRWIEGLEKQYGLKWIRQPRFAGR